LGIALGSQMRKWLLTERGKVSELRAREENGLWRV
jgi:hypothetical protein